MKFLFLLFIIWWVIFMTILPIKRSDFEEGMPKKSYLGIKFLVSLTYSNTLNETFKSFI
jgi:predicted secreted protein